MKQEFTSLCHKDREYCTNINLSVMGFVLFDIDGVFWFCYSFRTTMISITMTMTTTTTAVMMIMIKLFLMFISLRSSCSSSPCQNGGSCVANYKYDTFECLCDKAFYGKSFEKGK